MKKILTFSFSLLTVCAAFAQQQYTFTNYTEEQGLASGTILGMFKDNTGFIWLLSEEGISRFDGYNFKVFRHNPDDSTSIPNNSCSLGLQLANGDMWFQLFGELRLYEPEKLSFTNQFPYRDSSQFIFYSFILKNDSNALYIVIKDKIIRVKNQGCSYFPLPAKTGSNRNITASDSAGVIMISLWGKIFAFHAGTKQYERLGVDDRSGRRDTTVFDIFYTAAENTFTAISRKHLYRFSKEQNKFIPALDLQQLPLLGDRLIDPKARGIVGQPFFNKYYFAFSADGNLYKLDMKTGEEKIIHLNTKIPEEEIKDKTVNINVIDKNGILWIGTPGMGVFRFNTVTDKFEQLINEPGNPAGIPSNTVDLVLPDEAGVVWLACRGHGLLKMEPVVPLMESLSPAVSKSKVVSGGNIKNIRTFLETGSGYLVGTLQGLYNYDAAKKEFSEWADLFKAGTKENIIGTLAKDGSGNIWVGSWEGQLRIINPKNDKHISIQMPYNTFIPESDGRRMIRHLFCDSRNTIWIATYGGGAYTVNANEIDFDDSASVKFNPVLHDEKDASTISSNILFTITEDAEGNIWAGADNGLNCFQRSEKKWIRYSNIPGDASSIHGNNVRSFAFDKKGNMWVGTNGGGLNRYNKAQNNFTHFTMENGLPNDAIYTIVCDNSGMLWLGTNRGLCRFNPNNYSCTNFTLKDGIQNYEFNTGAGFKLKDGTLLIGGVEGYNIIHPEKIEINKASAPGVVISSIKVFDREVPPGNGLLRLSHTENSLTFEFAALSYYRNQDNKYAYKLEPINKEWIFCNDRKFVSYSNLEPGDYIFKVKACNNDGVWNETGTQLSITITPPWWKTWWFRAGFLLIAVSTVVWLVRRRTASLRKQKLILEKTVNQRTTDLRKQKEIAEQQRRRAEQSEKFKQQFLANMSHEIRTPMNAVMGMTNLLIDKNKNNENFKYLDGIQKSSNTLLHIINDILDFSKIEAGKIELEQIDFSIRDVIDQVKLTLHHKAEEKGLHLMTEIENKIPEVLIGDPVRLNQVLMNLAGNAIKFTEKGSVYINLTLPLSKGEGTGLRAEATPLSFGEGLGVRFSVTDTGIGIPKDKLQTVFESFSQAHASDARKFGGTGLGLTISKQLVELMDGKISIESEEGSGTTFSFEIDFAIGSKERLEEQKTAEDMDGSILNGLKILIADDNEFNRIVAKDTLLSKAEVEIVEAHNGIEAVEWLSKKDFDVVLMDVQMPVMDGYEATRQIRSQKSDVRNHSIPVIALTASVVRSDLDKCRAAGMIDYVPKPFKTFQLISAIAKAAGRESPSKSPRSGDLPVRKATLPPTMGAGGGLITNLSYLEKFCEGDKERMQKYIRMFLDSAPSLIEKVNSALEKNEFEEIANQIHAYKTKWIMMGMKESKDLAHKIEMQCREKSVNGETKENILNLVNQIQDAIGELKNS